MTVETIIGEIIKVIYQSKDHWTSLLVCLNDNKLITAVGYMPSPMYECKIAFTGNWKDHPKYGKQFSFSRYKLDEQLSEEGISKYLAQFIPGVGPGFASKIVGRFGTDTLVVIEKSPEQLAEIKGISLQKAESIHRAHLNNTMLNSLLEFFDFNITQRQAMAIYEVYHERSIEILEKDPYQLIFDVQGFGFKRVDALAKKLQISDDDPRRITACLYYILTDVTKKGHCYMGIYSLYDQALDLIPRITKHQFQTALNGLINSKKAVSEIALGIKGINENAKIYAGNLYYEETKSAEILVDFIMDPLGNYFSESDITKLIKSMERKTGYEITDKQKKAVKMALTKRVSVITGGPGTGKSTIVQAITEAFPEDCIALLAPTGKAAQRMAEITHHSALTIFRYLYYGEWHKDDFDENDFGGDQSNQVNTNVDLIVVDEASMIDIPTAYSLLKIASQNGSSIVFIGDVDQLPPIGAGHFFTDLVRSPLIESTTLTECFRQSGTIAKNAKRIRESRGAHTLTQDESFQIIPVEKDSAQAVAVSEYLKLYHKYGPREVCCVTPMRQKKKNPRTSCEAINEVLQEKLNPPTDTNIIPNCSFRVGDRVMQIKNDYKKWVFNGDCGIVDSFDNENGILYVSFDKEPHLRQGYSIQDANLMLTMAYAMSVHKVQGSEYLSVLVVEIMADFKLLKRNLIYTAVTRAKEEVVIVGESKAITFSIDKPPEEDNRQTLLCERITKQYSDRKTNA